MMVCNRGNIGKSVAQTHTEKMASDCPTVSRGWQKSVSFVSVNCAAIPRDLILSELFGHEKGAFTGAVQRRLGRFELAEGGTIFLDEIGELNAETQVALPRVLQEREFDQI
jgi:formate hydrogenlyase transcriptional activator